MTWTPPSTGKVFQPQAAPDPEPSTSNLKPWERGKTWQPGSTPAPAPEPPAPEQSTDPQGGLVKAWSASILDKFEKCPYAVFLGRVRKVPDQPSEARDRGSRVHDLAEKFIKAEIAELPKELTQYGWEYHNLRDQFAAGTVMCEDNWGFDVEWNPVDWMAPNIWARMKLDTMVTESPTSAKIIDLKTGKKFGNELKHAKQGMIYTVGAFMRYPELEFIQVEFWYPDVKDAKLEAKYTRNEMVVFLPQVERRAIKLTSATNFPPKPSEHNCRFCDYAKNNVCEWAQA